MCSTMSENPIVSIFQLTMLEVVTLNGSMVYPHPTSVSRPCCFTYYIGFDIVNLNIQCGIHTVNADGLLDEMQA